MEKELDGRKKSMKTTTLLAILPGFVGLQGLAHIFLGKKVLGIYLWQIYDARKLYEEIILKSEDRSNLSRILRHTGGLFCAVAGFVGMLLLISFALNIAY